VAGEEEEVGAVGEVEGGDKTLWSLSYRFLRTVTHPSTYRIAVSFFSRTHQSRSVGRSCAVDWRLQQCGAIGFDFHDNLSSIGKLDGDIEKHQKSVLRLEGFRVE
jgi:hypothetical protein